MAGHSKFKNIQHRKNAQDKRRAKLFTRLVREIISAARIGGPDQNHNPRLRNAIIAARAHNLPKDRIDRALLQASDPSKYENYFEIRYEGFAPYGVAIIVEALTDNKNKAASEVRSAFTKFGGALGETGSVSFMFDHLGTIQYPVNIGSTEKIFENIIECGASDLDSDEEYHTIYSEIEQFSHCCEFFLGKYGNAEDSYIGWKPKNYIEIEEEEKISTILKLIDLLEESEEVQKVFSNLS